MKLYQINLLTSGSDCLLWAIRHIYIARYVKNLRVHAAFTEYRRFGFSHLKQQHTVVLASTRWKIFFFFTIVSNVIQIVNTSLSQKLETGIINIRYRRLKQYTGVRYLVLISMACFWITEVILSMLRTVNHRLVLPLTNFDHDI